jgi:hypothetical protein
LKFGDLFKQPLSPGDIPDSVTRLTFGYFFDQPLSPGVIPNSVTHLTFGTVFNQPLSPGDIPGSVTHLKFGDEFFQTLSPGVIPGSVTHLKYPAQIRLQWRNFMRLVYSSDKRVPDELEMLYRSGFPIPVEPHEDSTLKILDDKYLNSIRIYSIDRNLHTDIIQKADEKLVSLINNWIYGDYASFNKFITDMNMGIPSKYTNGNFLGLYVEENTTDVQREAIQEYRDLRKFIMNAPRVDHKIYAWRGLHGLDELCSNAKVGSYIAFTRFMACSVSQEVSCNFARDGVLLLVELPPNIPFLNLTGMKKSEPEFILPDRTIFKVISRFPAPICEGISCDDIVHIRLEGLYTEDDRGVPTFEEYYSPDPPEQIRVDQFY